jgi:hypothetical protein
MVSSTGATLDTSTTVLAVPTPPRLSLTDTVNV